MRARMVCRCLQASQPLLLWSLLALTCCICLLPSYAFVVVLPPTSPACLPQAPTRVTRTPRVMTYNRSLLRAKDIGQDSVQDSSSGDNGEEQKDSSPEPMEDVVPDETNEQQKSVEENNESNIRLDTTIVTESVKDPICSTLPTDETGEQSKIDLTTDYVVFGGGFGGLYTALELDQLLKAQGVQDPKISLVTPTDSFVFLPLLYDLAVGTATQVEVCPTYKSLLSGTSVKHVPGRLVSLSAATQCATVQLNDHTKSSVSPSRLSFAKGAVVAVGASPESILAKVPGATSYAQPFYNASDALAVREWLESGIPDKFDRPLRIAVVGGGFGGVELAASLQRRLGSDGGASVSLLASSPPLQGTRAENLVRKALDKLGVHVEYCRVQAIEPVSEQSKSDGRTRTPLFDKPLVQIRRTCAVSGEAINVDDEEPWDFVFWTAGSSPSDPIPSGCFDLQPSPVRGGGLLTDASLRCMWTITDGSTRRQPNVWALGDCATIGANAASASAFAVPKTAQAAMQQASTVANNVVACCSASSSTDTLDRKTAKKYFRLSPKPQVRDFVFQDLGNVLTLGGPNAAVLAPKTGPLAPLVAPLMDTANAAFSLADQILTDQITKLAERQGLPSPATLGLSLGSHGLAGSGSDDGKTGTTAGTIAGAARRAVYAARMPTNEQRAVALASAAISTAASLAREVREQQQDGSRRKK